MYFTSRNNDSRIESAIEMLSKFLCISNERRAKCASFENKCIESMSFMQTEDKKHSVCGIPKNWIKNRKIFTTKNNLIGLQLSALCSQNSKNECTVHILNSKSKEH